MNFSPFRLTADEREQLLAAKDRVLIELRSMSWTSFDRMLLRRGGRRHGPR